MHRVILVAALLTAGCTNDPSVAFVGLWAGTYVETDTNRETGESTTFEPMAINWRIRQDADGLYVDGEVCDILLRATTTTRLRVLPSSCDVDMGRVDFLDGDGTLSSSGVLTMEVSGTFRGSGLPVFDVRQVLTLERAD